MKNLIRISAVFFIACFACTANAQDSKSFPVKNFNSISISSGIDLYLTQSNSEGVMVKSDSETLKDVVVEQNGNDIRIKFKDGVKWGGMFKNRIIKAYVNYKTLNELAASGGSDVVSQNQIKTDKLAIRASGGSDIKLTVVSNDLTLQSSGGSDVSLKGKATNMTIQSSGGSDVNAFELITDYAKVQASGGSDVNIYVNKGLEASASGGGDVTYKGNAALNKTSSSKSGEVHYAN